jgi:CBS domain-containing protein
MKTGIKVGDIMTRNPLSCSPETPVLEAVKKMCKERMGSVVVKEGKNVVGIVTERDILVALTKKKDLRGLKVKDVMCKRLITISPDKDIYDAILLMKKKQIRRLPVVVDHELLGLITVRDIIKIYPSLFDVWAEAIRIKEEAEKLKRAGTEEEYYERLK